MKIKISFKSSFINLALCLVFAIFSLEVFATPNGTQPINILMQALEKEQPENKIFFATLATTDGHKPSVRMIQVSATHDKEVIQFYTHSNTHKVSDFKSNHSHASLNYWLPNTKTQVTLDGSLTLINRKNLLEAWAKMPRNMQIQFIVSDHKSELPSSNYLIEKAKSLDALLPSNIPLPDEFVGFNFQPNKFTFYVIKKGTFPDKFTAQILEDKWIWTDMQP